MSIFSPLQYFRAQDKFRVSQKLELQFFYLAKIILLMSNSRFVLKLTYDDSFRRHYAT